MKLTWRLAAVLVAMVLACGLVAATGVRGLLASDSDLRQVVYGDVERLVHTTHVRRLFRSMGVAERDHILQTTEAGRRANAEQMRRLRVDLANELRRCQELTSGSDRATFDALEAAYHRWVALDDQVLALSDQNRDQEAYDLAAKHRTDPLQWEPAIADLLQHYDANLAQRTAAALTRSRRSREVLWWTALAAVLVATAAGASVLAGVRRNVAEVLAVNANLEALVAERTRELAKSNEELERFAYVASHDLQEPLRMVASYLQLLQRRYQGSLDADADEFIGFAVDGATRMKRLITDLLSYSRVRTQGRPLAPVDSQAVFDTVRHDLDLAIADSGATVTADPLPRVMADEGQLGQLLQNLVGNALKFHGEAPPQVHIGARREGDRWIFTVRDNGIGLEPAYAERIFGIFQRLHGVGVYPGTGIGLAVCRGIVERHGGQITVQSELGQGATFTFDLPAADDEPAQAG